MDDWGNDDAQDASDDEAMYRAGTPCYVSCLSLCIDNFPTCKAKPSKTKPKAQKKTKPPPPQTTSLSAYRSVVSKEQEDAFMSGLLGDWDVSHALATSKADSRPGKRKSSPDYHYDDRSSSPVPPADRRTAYSRGSHYSHRDPFADTSSDGPPSDGFDVIGDLSSDDGLITSPKKKVRTEAKGNAPAIEKMSAMGVAGYTDTREDDYDKIFLWMT